MNKTDQKRELAIELITKKYEEIGRIPKRSDFDSETACLIKQKLGPWPRALEVAGLKIASGISAKEKSKLKRERIKNNKKKSGDR